MNPQKLIMTVLKAYESFDSYSDTGTCTADDYEGQLKFETHFKRPDKFRFHCLDLSTKDGEAPKELLLRSDGNRFIEGMSKTIEEFESLSQMVSNAFLKSRGSAEQVLKTLTPYKIEPGKAWYEISNAKSLSDESINGIQCFHVVGSLREAADSETWIEKKTFRIRRIIKKIILTDEVCQQMNSRMQGEYGKSLVESWKKAGVDQGIIEYKLACFKAAFTPSTTVYTYNFDNVLTNEIIGADLFEKP